MIQLIIIWGLILLFIFEPSTAHSGAAAGAQLFVQALLPYLLPYIILTQWLLKIPTQSVKSNRWKTYVKAYILGSFGGFPVGAVTVAELVKKKELTKHESSFLLAACHAPGPMFVIGFVGNELFTDGRAGWHLLISIHFVNIVFFLIALFFLSFTSIEQLSFSQQKEFTTSAPLLQAIKDSSSIIILVATTVIFFSSLGTVLSSVITNSIQVDWGVTQTILLSIFEMTSGVQAATNHFFSYDFYPYIVAAILSLNGLSIHMQVYVIAKSAQIPLFPYVVARIWSVILVPTVLFLLTSFLS